MTDHFRSYVSRQRDAEPRVHTELNLRSRERLASITEEAGNYQKSAFSDLTDEVGYSRIEEASPNQRHREFVLNADTELVLGYIEHLINNMWARITSFGYQGTYDREDVRNKIAKINDVIITEGLLFEIEAASDNAIQFRPTESEAMEEVDREIQVLGGRTVGEGTERL